ncbi:MAG: hypothetical protein ACK4HF_08710 [Paracoccaceae bacterium]
MWRIYPPLRMGVPLVWGRIGDGCAYCKGLVLSAGLIQAGPAWRCAEARFAVEGALIHGGVIHV